MLQHSDGILKLTMRLITGFSSSSNARFKDLHLSGTANATKLSYTKR